MLMFIHGAQTFIFSVVSECAEEALWHCMLEHPHDLFLPLLNEFNRLYQIVRDQKRYTNLTAEETAEEKLVRNG